MTTQTITPDATLDAIRAVVRADPRERSNWLVLADRLRETGQTELAAAWEWMAATRRWPVAVDVWRAEMGIDRPKKAFCWRWRRALTKNPTRASVPPETWMWLLRNIPPLYDTESEALSALATALAMTGVPPE